MSADASLPFRLKRAGRILHQGGVIAYPTEAVYGLGCDPRNRDAVYRLLEIKQRPPDKGLILIASKTAQLAPYIEPLDAALRQRLEATWPGPVTWLLPARPGLPGWLRGTHATIATRVTAHPLAAALCDSFGGAIVSTSANRAGQRPARSALQARLRCPGVNLIVHGATGGLDRPTRILDARSGETLRAG